MTNGTGLFNHPDGPETATAGGTPVERTRAGRERVVAQAAAEGRFPDTAERRSHWLAQYDRDPATTHRLLTAPDSHGGLVAALAPAGYAVGGTGWFDPKGAA